MNRNPKSLVFDHAQGNSTSHAPKHRPRDDCSPSPSQTTAALPDATLLSPFRGGKWTQEEDERLKLAVQRTGAKNWSKVAGIVGGRNSI